MIERESIQTRLPPNFNVQIDGDRMSFTTTRDGKPYEISTSIDLVTGEFGEPFLEMMVRTCQRFNEEGSR